jgi:hypothetical protein
MSVVNLASGHLDPASAAAWLVDLGFLVNPDLPDRPGPARLLLAMRAEPTLRHYDPEAVEYWVTQDGRGRRRILNRETRLPIEATFSWGLIKIVDRLHVTNEYLTFGGHLSADAVDGVVIAVFTSPAPLLSRGGHSQGWDPGAEKLGAFFGRFLLAIDYAPGFEARVATADPVVRYAAFLADTMARYRASSVLRAEQPDLWALLQAEERRLRADRPVDWASGIAFGREASEAISGPVSMDSQARPSP